jgi:hypothetical protein
MKKATRRRPRMGKDAIPNQQQTMDNNSYGTSSAYLVQTFSLNSFSRQVVRKHLNRQPDPSYSRTNAPRTQTLSEIASARKCSDVDFRLLSQCFRDYEEAVNLALSRVYSSEATMQELGQKLSESYSKGCTDMSFSHQERKAQTKNKDSHVTSGQEEKQLGEKKERGYMLRLLS